MTAIHVDPAQPGADSTDVTVVLPDGRVIDLRKLGTAGNVIVVSSTQEASYHLAIEGAKTVEDTKRNGPTTSPFLGLPAAFSGKLAPCGRNELCPCGSGRKYKKCHRGKPLPQR